MRKIITWSLYIILFLACSEVKAQNVALKSNLLADISASPNLALEFKTAKKFSFEITGELNAWDVNRHKWKHWLVEPEMRYWPCQTFAGHFFAIHALAGQYNFGNIHNNINFLGSDFSRLTNYRYQGWGAGAGIAYGYTWILSKHWSCEAEIGIGWIYTRFDEFECDNCGKKIREDVPHNYVGPTKAALNLIYVF